MDHKMISFKRCYALFLILFMSQLLWAQQTKVSGNLISENDGQPIIGASILESGTGNGVISDINGNFSITVKRSAKLQISCVGYTTKVVNVSPQMKKYIVPILFLVIVFSSSCQNKDDYEAANPLLESLTENAMKGNLSGSDYVWEWTYSSEHLSMHIDVYCNGSKLTSLDTTDSSFTLSDITANSEYVFCIQIIRRDKFFKRFSYSLYT